LINSKILGPVSLVGNSPNGKKNDNKAPAETHLVFSSSKYQIPQKRTVGPKIKYIHMGKLVEKNKENFDNYGWVLDSGATNHMTGNKTRLHNSIQDFVYAANGEKK
jgi:hypothetical protein